MVAMYGLPIICPPYDLHIKPHLIPLILPLSQVFHFPISWFFAQIAEKIVPFTVLDISCTKLHHLIYQRMILNMFNCSIVHCQLHFPLSSLKISLLLFQFLFFQSFTFSSSFLQSEHLLHTTAPTHPQNDKSQYFHFHC